MGLTCFGKWPIMPCESPHRIIRILQLQLTVSRTRESVVLVYAIVSRAQFVVNSLNY